MSNIKVLATVGCLLVFAACNKSDDKKTTPVPTTSKKDLVVNGQWKWTGLSVVVPGSNGQDSLVDGWSAIQECKRDDIMTYAADGTGKIDEMATKCDPADPQVKNLTWEFINNETQVKVTDNEGPHVMTIVELTASKAVYKQSTVATGGDTITFQQTFTNVK